MRASKWFRCLVMIVLLFSGRWVPADDQTRRILLLDSYGPDIEPYSTIISFWDRYHWQIAGVVALLLFQALLIARLKVQMRRRHHAEHQLVKIQQRLRLFTNALPVLIAYVDSELRYQFNNDAFKMWFGIRPEQAQGRTMLEVMEKRLYRDLLPYVNQALAGKKVCFTHELEPEAGQRISAETIFVPETDEQGAVAGFYLLAVDVTKRNAAQQEFRHLNDELANAGRISSLGELAGALAHEINQPLSAIMSNAQAAVRYLNAPVPDLKEVKEILDDIIAEDTRASQIIQSLRSLLKTTNQEDFEPLDLNMILQEVLDLLQSNAVIPNVRIYTELAPRLPKVKGDRIQLQQVVLNLLTNAFEAIYILGKANRSVHIRTWQENSQVFTAIKDRGIGIASQLSEKIFNSFYTTKPHGLGMGLSISRSIINRHQGRIWVENNRGSGVTFYFSLPVPSRSEGRTHDMDC